MKESEIAKIFGYFSSGEKDVKRREAVRRKTAQYLLKAEALYSTYLAGNDSYEKSEVHVTTNWLT